MPRTEAQIAASRANGMRSKGPLSPETKAISAKNGYKHGMAGQGVVRPEHETLEVEARSARMMAEMAPGTTVAGSHALTTERTHTSHTEAAPSGIFAQDKPETSPHIGIDDFLKVDLRVARIVLAERIPKADKLLRLEVDLGYEKRQILSGIAPWYTPEELLGRRIVIVANLAPRKMRGLESHGMLLAASSGEDGKPILATFGDTEDLPLGSKVR